MDHLLDAGALERRAGEGELVLGPAAAEAFARFGVRLPGTPPRRMLAYACMDSRLGRPHLGGQLGAQLAAALRGRGWVEPGGEPRRLSVSAAGRRGLRRLDIELPTAART